MWLALGEVGYEQEKVRAESRLWTRIMSTKKKKKILQSRTNKKSIGSQIALGWQP